MNFRPRFSLRMMFVALTIGVIAAWWYWIGGPRWQVYCEKQRFVEMVKQFKAGMQAEQLHKRWEDEFFGGGMSSTGKSPPNVPRPNEEGKYPPPTGSYNLIHKMWDNEIYCIYYEVSEPANELGRGKMDFIELYRVSPLPPSYLKHFPYDRAIQSYIGSVCHLLHGNHGFFPAEADEEFYLDLIYADHPEWKNKFIN
jgi:hypothetical protein